jgi:hypothetical protein
MVGSLSTVTSVVSLAKVTLIDCGEVGRTAVMLSDYVRSSAARKHPFHRWPRAKWSEKELFVSSEASVTQVLRQSRFKCNKREFVNFGINFLYSV